MRRMLHCHRLHGEESLARNTTRGLTCHAYMQWSAGPDALWHSLPDFVDKHILVYPENVHTLGLNPNATTPNGLTNKSIGLIQLKMK